MSQGTLREFVTLLGFEVDGSPISKMEKDLHHLKETIHTVMEVYVGEKVIKGLMEGMREFAENSREIMDSQLLGLGTSQYQVLQQGAAMFGVQRQRFNMGLALMQRNAYEAIRGNKEAAITFATLGVTVTDTNGKLKNAQQLIYEISDGMKKFKNDPSTRTALGEKLFGMRDIEFQNLLLKGSEGLRNLTKDAQELGYVMDEHTIESGKEFNENLVRFQFIAMGLKNRLMAELVPVINQTARAFMDWLRIPENKAFVLQKIHEVAVALVDIFKALYQITTQLLTIFYGFARTVGGVGNAVKLLIYGFMAMLALNVGGKLIHFGIDLFALSKRIMMVVNALGMLGGGYKGLAATLRGSGILFLLWFFYKLITDIWGFFHGKKSLVGLVGKSIGVSVGHLGTDMGGGSHLTEYAQSRMATLAGSTTNTGGHIIVNQHNQVTVQGGAGAHETGTVVAEHIKKHTQNVIKDAGRKLSPRKAY